jgi:restriction system protein
LKPHRLLGDETVEWLVVYKYHNFGCWLFLPARYWCMKFFEVLVVLNLCAIANLHGQLNASSSELVERFGQPTSKKGNQTFGSTEFVFLSEGWVIRASLLDDRCHMISHLRSQLPWPNPGEIELLLNMNSGGYSWSSQGVRLAVTGKTARGPSSQVHYPRSDGGAYLVKAINGVVFKSAHWQRLETGTRGDVAAAPRRTQSHPSPLVVPHIKSAPSLPEPVIEVTNSVIRAETMGWSPRPTPQPMKYLRLPSIDSYLIFAGGITLFLLAPALMLFLRSPSAKGWIGEKLTYLLILKRLDPAAYQIFNNVYLPRPDGQGSTQIDHVVLSRYGIFAIETKNLKGWIFGKEQDRQWTQQLYRKKVTFQNPLRQNFLHVEALRTSLDLPRKTFHSVVFFVGDCELKTGFPPNVITSGLKCYIESHRLVVLDQEQVASAGAALTDLRKGARNDALRLNHIRHLRERYGGDGERKVA